MNGNEFDKIQKLIEEEATLEEVIKLIPSLFRNFNIEGIAKINDTVKMEVKKRLDKAIAEHQKNIDDAKKITTVNMNAIEQVKKLAATICV